MPGTIRTPRSAAPNRAARRGGHLTSALVSAVIYYLVNVRPGWQAVPFLTPATTEVLPLVNASIIVGMVVELVYVLAEPRWLRSLGTLVTAAVGLAAMLALWRVFPLDVAGSSFPWASVVRVVLVLGIVGCFAGILGGVGMLIRPGARRGRERMQ